jgi:drug/metabolite transporter (DMT)-like permease
MSKVSLLLVTLAAFSAAAGQLLFKIGARGREHLTDFVNPPILSGLLLYGVGTLIWIHVLAREKLTSVYAFTALSFVLVYLGGVFVIGESISRAGMAGIALVLAGLYLITGYNV